MREMREGKTGKQEAGEEEWGDGRKERGEKMKGMVESILRAI